MVCLLLKEWAEKKDIDQGLVYETHETLPSLLYFPDPSKRKQFLQFVFILTFEFFSLSS